MLSHGSTPSAPKSSIPPVHHQQQLSFKYKLTLKTANQRAERETGTADKVGREEKHEIGVFKDALCGTKVMRFLLEYLKVHGKDKRCRKLRSLLDLQNLIQDLWFDPYRRFKVSLKG